MDFFNPSSWDDPFEDIVDLGKTVIDGARDAAEDAVGVAVTIGEGIVDGAVMIGEGIVTAGEGAAKWSINAAGDAVDWTKTSFAEVAEWTENAAGLVANFSVEAYHAAYAAVEAAYEFLKDYFTETLPDLGGLDPKAREAAAYLLSEPVARGIEALADVIGATIMFGIKLTALSSVNVGLYVCGGGWGFFLDSGFSSFESLIQNPSLSLGVAAQVTMVFRSVSQASGAKAIKFGAGMNSNPAKKLAVNIGGVVLMEATAPPLFLGLRYAMELSLDLFGKKKTVDEAGKLKWKVKTTLPKPNGELVTDGVDAVSEIGWEDITCGLGSQASHFDAALRAKADPAGADRLVTTALAASLSPLKPRYYGQVRTDRGQLVVGTSQGALGLDLAGDRKVVQLVSGLTDPTCVSFETVGEPPLYWCVKPSGELGLVPYDRSQDLSGTTFRMTRGRAGRGASFALAKDGQDNPRFLCATRVFGGIVMPTPVLRAERLSGIEAPTSSEATFLLDRPVDQPEEATSILRPGQHLKVDQIKRAPNGMFALLLAANGRLHVRKRGSAGMSSPTYWLAYEPGLIQGEVILWGWASPQPAAAPGYHAVVTTDGRLAVRAGADPSQAGATLWQSEVRGAPGLCFLAVTNQGVVTLTRGTPDAPGEIVWSSFNGALYWPARRRQVVLKCAAGYVSADQGGGLHDPLALTQAPAQPVRFNAARVGGWEAFELQDLCTGEVALRAQGRRFVGVQAGGVGLTCLNDHVGDRERFTLEVVGGGNGAPQQVRLKSVATGAYVGAVGGTTQLGATGSATTFELIEVEHDLTAHSGRFVHAVAAHSGKALEVPDARTDNGVGLVQGRFCAAEHQKWILTYVGEGWYTLTNRSSGKNIDIYGGQTSAGAGAIQWPAHDGANQRFSLTPTGDGHYYIVARHSGQALDVAGASQNGGAQVLQWPLSGAVNQRWRISLASAEIKTYAPVTITGVDQLLALEAIRLKSWKGDYLSRPDAPQGVTTATPGDTWRLSRNANGTLSLRSWKGDYLHRPNSPQGVTTYSTGVGNEWTLELRGAKVLLRSWKGDYLHRPDGPATVTTWGSTIGSEWTVDALLP